MTTMSKPRVVVLGAGFGGLELTTLLSESLGDSIDVTLIDKSDHFVFGFSKLDVMFGHKEPEAVRLPYANYAKPGVKLLKRTITQIDPVARRVTTDNGVFDADIMVVALGAEYDFDATPGLAGTTEFYTVPGAEKLRHILPTFKKGRALVGVCGAPYKCPPAPSECALMLHDYLVSRGIRNDCEIDLVLPLPSPVPPSPETSRALIAAFAERNIRFTPGRRIASVDNATNVAVLDNGTEMPFDLFLGVPKHRVPSVVLESGMATVVAFIAFPTTALRPDLEHGPIARGVWFGIAGISCMAFVQAMTFSFFERIGADSGYGFEAVTGVLIALGFVNLIPAPLAGFLQNRISPRSVVISGPIVQAALAVLITSSTSFTPYALAGSVFVAVMIFTHTFAFGLLARLDPSARSVAGTPAMLMSGAALGPIVGGTLIKSSGYSSLGIAAVIVALVAVACFSQARATAPAGAAA